MHTPTLSRGRWVSGLATRLAAKVRYPTKWLERPFSKGVRFVKESDLVLLVGTSKAEQQAIEDAFRGELVELERLSTLLALDGTFVDIGAQKGFITCAAAARFKRVVAVEGRADERAFLRSNVDTNGLSHIELASTVAPPSGGPHTDATPVALDALFEAHRIERCDVLRISTAAVSDHFLRCVSAPVLARVSVITLRVREGLVDMEGVPHLLSCLERAGFDAQVIQDRITQRDFYSCSIVALSERRFNADARATVWSALKPEMGRGARYMGTPVRRAFEARRTLARAMIEQAEQLAPLYAGQNGKAWLGPDSGPLEDHLAYLRFCAFQPEVVFFWSSPWIHSQYIIWKPYIEALSLRTAVVAQGRGKKAAPLLSRVPIFFADEGCDHRAIRFNRSVQAVLHTRGGAKNYQLLNTNGLANVFIGHGDSDKHSSVSPLMGAYTKVFVAGEHAIQRFVREGLSLPSDKFECVGVPVDPQVEVGRRPGPIRTILYAPTWEGYGADRNCSSIEYMEGVLAQLKTECPEMRILFLPHPGTGKRLHEYREISHRIESQIAAQPIDRTQKIKLFNESDLIISDVSGVTSEYLFTEKPIVMPVAPKGSPIRQTQITAAGSAIYRLDLEEVSLRDLIALIDGGDPLAPARLREKEVRMGGARTFPDAMKLFEDALRRTIAAHGRRPFDPPAVAAASAALRAANAVALDTAVVVNDSGSSVGFFFLASPYGLAEPEKFAGARFKVIALDAKAKHNDVPLTRELRVGDVVRVERCEYLQDIFKYRLRLRNERTGAVVRKALPKLAVTLEVLPVAVGG